MTGTNVEHRLIPGPSASGWHGRVGEPLRDAPGERFAFGPREDASHVRVEHREHDRNTNPGNHCRNDGASHNNAADMGQEQRPSGEGLEPSAHAGR